MKKVLIILACVLATAGAVNVDEIISLGAGTSKVMTLNYVVKSVAIGNPKLLDVIVLGKQEIMLNSKETGITSLTIWENNKVYNYKVAIGKESSGIIMKKYKLSNIELTWTNPEDPKQPEKLKTDIRKETVESIQKILSNIVDPAQIQMLPFENSVLIIGSPSEQANVANAIESIDVKEPLTLYEIEVYEVTDASSLATKLALKFGNDESLSGETTYQSNTLASDSTATDPSTILSLNSNTYTAAGKVASYATQILKALQTENKAKLLATPKLLCLNNKASIITEYETYPIVSTDKDGNISVDYMQTGVVLDLVSNASYNSDYVNCWMEASVSSITGYTSQGYPRSGGRAILTNSRIKNKDTLIIGGLLKDVENTSISKIPVLGDLLGWIPIVGSFFKNESVDKTQTELVITIKPTIITDK